MNDEPPAARSGCFGRSTWTVALVAAVVAGGAYTLLLSVSTPRSAVYVSVTQNNLKQVGLGLHNYHSAFGRFPPPPGDAGASDPPAAWMTALLPFIDEGEVWNRYDKAAAYDDPANAAAVAAEIDAYLTPIDGWRDRRAEGGFGLAHYAGNAAVLGPGGAGDVRGMRDGTTGTLLAGQIEGFPKPWADPANLRDAAAGLGTGPRQFGTPLRYGDPVSGQFVMGDGSVRLIKDDIDPAVFAALGTPDGGEDVGAY